jgi:glycyl-tRNA synthetase
MANQDEILKKIVSHSKEYGYVFQSSEIYDGLSATYDYGPYGSELKNNIRQYWWKAMVQMHENIFGIESAIFMHPTTWKASGHLDAFNDPLIDNKDSKKRYRADDLIESYIEKTEAKIEKEITKAKKRFGDDFDEKMYRETNPRVSKYVAEVKDISSRLKKALDEGNLAYLKSLILELEINCPLSGSKNWTDVRQFNLMFSTQAGTDATDKSTIYLRPETAQGSYVNYLNVQKTSRMKLPFGIAQTGKSFRNEIIARQFIFRMREFEQMEMQFFVKPGEEAKWYDYWKENRINWHRSLGLAESYFRFHDHLKLAHYANAACDIEFEFPFGFKELEGIHSRTDFDLSAHEKHSGKKLRYFDPDTRESYVPYVVETAIGLDRMFLAIITAAYHEEKLDDGSERTVLKIPDFLAPVKACILPLVKKDNLPEKAREVMNNLKFDFNCQFDEKDSIGKRYRRQDAIGTPYCITVDHQTLEDNTVTIRERDSMSQSRVAISELNEIINKKVSMKEVLRKLEK